jgi:hypothetical protein
VKTIAALAALAVLLYVPAIAAALVAVVGAVLIAVASNPPLLAFAAGLWARPNIDRKTRRRTA